MNSLTALILCVFTPVLAFADSVGHNADRDRAESQRLYTWSSSNCKSCTSTIYYSSWYGDRTDLLGEAMSGSKAGVLTAISAIGSNLVVAMSVSIDREPSLAVDLRKAVTLETDSAPHMVLYALEKPGPGVHKGSVTVKQQFKAASKLVPHKPVAGFLLFPLDRAAANITVVVTIGSETFRFPFARDPKAHEKFGDPARFGSEVPILQAATQAKTPAPSQATAHADSPRPTARAAANVISTVPSTLIKSAKSASNEVGPCVKNISFAVAEGGQIVSRAPKFTGKWIEKNQKKFPSICFSQAPSRDAANFVVVFSVYQSAFDGIHPTVRTSTTSSVAPISGQGTIISNYGAMWNYSYSGTSTTTTTTTYHVNLPYRDTTKTLFAFSYDQTGNLVSRRWREVTTRQGGDGANTLGYNLGSALVSIHIKERLLKEVVDDLAR